MIRQWHEITCLNCNFSRGLGQEQNLHNEQNNSCLRCIQVHNLQSISTNTTSTVRLADVEYVHFEIFYITTQFFRFHGFDSGRQIFTEGISYPVSYCGYRIKNAHNTRSLFHLSVNPVLLSLKQYLMVHRHSCYLRKKVIFT